MNSRHICIVNMSCWGQNANKPPHFVHMCRSAHLISRYRPRAPILAVTRNAQTARQAHLYRGIFPVLYTKPAHDVWAEDVDMRVNFAMEMGQ